MKRKNNNGVFYVVISLVAVLAIGLGVVAFTGNAERVIENVEVYNEASQPAVEVVDGNLGAVSGPDVYQKMYFHSGFQSGGDVIATTSTATTYTLVAKDILFETYYIDWTPSATTTITTMASSSAGMINMGIPTAGDTRVLYIYNNSTLLDDINITLAAGTGVDLQKNEDTADLAINGTSVGKLTFIRKPNTDVMLILEQWDVAD